MRFLEKIKASRPASFLALFVAYSIAAVSGCLIYKAVGLSWWLSLFIADVLATAVIFGFSLLFSNASAYDPYWSVQPIVILWCFMAEYGFNTAGVIFTAVITLWGIRLTANWAYTFKNLNSQDWRYTMLREKTGTLYPLVNFVGIHLVPTVVVYAVTLPAAYLIINGIFFKPIALVFLCISVIAFSLQGIADVQMHAYRKNRTTPFIRRGLWKYSRHPNYLGEILTWWGVGLAALTLVPSCPYLLIGAIMNTALFLFVSIPLAEGKQSKKEGYDAYRAQTRALLPIPKRTK